MTTFNISMHNVLKRSDTLQRYLPAYVDVVENGQNHLQMPAVCIFFCIISSEIISNQCTNEGSRFKNQSFQASQMLKQLTLTGVPVFLPRGEFITLPWILCYQCLWSQKLNLHLKNRPRQKSLQKNLHILQVTKVQLQKKNYINKQLPKIKTFN